MHIFLERKIVLFYSPHYTSYILKGCYCGYLNSWELCSPILRAVHLPKLLRTTLHKILVYSSPLTQSFIHIIMGNF